MNDHPDDDFDTLDTEAFGNTATAFEISDTQLRISLALFIVAAVLAACRIAWLLVAWS